MFAALGLWQPASDFLIAVIAFLFAVMPLMVFEKIYPGTNAARGYLKGMGFWAISLLVTYAWSKIAILIIGSLDVSPLLVWKVPSESGFSIKSFIVGFGIVLSMWIFDFFYYWFHRAQHKFSVLWRFHRVHHSIQNLNCVACYHHPFEEIFRFPFVSLPLLFFVRIDVQSLVFVSAFAASWGYFIHSDSRVQFGAIGNTLLGDNYYHRVHHSLDVSHWNKNFAAFFPMWDRIFGTYCRPPRHYLPSVGLDNLSTPHTVSEYVMTPFRTDT